MIQDLDKKVINSTDDPIEDERGFIHMAFQLVKIGSQMEPLVPYTLILQVNPESLTENMTQSKNVVVTKGGYVEFLWPEELDKISCSSSTGLFIGKEFGMTNIHKDDTIAYKKMQELIRLYENNGVVYNTRGTPLVRSSILMIYDRGVYSGHFTSLSITESSENPYQFNMSWTFVVESRKMVR